ncbi:MAG: diadenylate cyclase CdaA [Tepidiformaceae bacterium]
MPDISHIRELLEQFTWSSAVDVLLIAIVVFSAIRLVSGTRAMTQLRGVLLVLLIAVLFGRIFDLTVVNFLVEQSVTALIVGAAIVFQPEIRRGLDRLGRTGLQGFATRAKWEDVIDAVSRASGRMASEHYGGLIVFERDTGLQDVIETGVPVDARISPELLAGIFFPNSPLHDMAVVIRDDRVVAAGCVLPLSDNLADGDRSYGTRHRAAVGITEQTDALSVVVSEETGAISVAVGGKLTPVADERRLQAVLEWLLIPEDAANSSRARNGRSPG